MCHQQICPQMPHMLSTWCGDIRQLCQYICLIWTQCNQHVTTKTVFIHSYYCHIPPEQIYFPHCIYVFHCTSTICRHHIILHISKKTTNCNYYLPCYIHIGASNKYASQMPHIPITSSTNMRQPYLYMHPIVLDMPLNKYAYHIAHVYPTAILL